MKKTCYIFGLLVILALAWCGMFYKNEDTVIDKLPEQIFPTIKSEVQKKDFYGESVPLSEKFFVYRNSALGFSLEIPKELNLSLQKSEIWESIEKQEYKRYYFHFTSNAGGFLSVNVEETKYESIEKWYSENGTSGLYFQDSMDLKNRTIVSGVPAIVLDYGFENSTFSECTFFIYNGLLYDVSIYNISAEESAHIFSSFKLKE